MKRRKFLTWVGVGGVATSIPALSPAYSQDIITQSPTDGFEQVGTLTQLNQNGQILQEEFSEDGLLVIKDPTNPNNIIAINPTCPHAGCIVDWKPDQNQFICPCHGSKFTSNGQIISGRTRESLAQYETKIEGDIILIKNV